MVRMNSAEGSSADAGRPESASDQTMSASSAVRVVDLTKEVEPDPLVGRRPHG
ncbi:MAG TPA: hypothetical protein VM658_14865 [bacterium]|nr:hypothetical protein [bacterium]